MDELFCMGKGCLGLKQTIVYAGKSADGIRNIFMTREVALHTCSTLQ